MTTNPTTTPETQELKRGYYDELPITTIAEAEKFCDCPPHDQLKCNRCARTIPYTRDTPYIEVASCTTFGCGGQMMGTDWAGWYNHWRDLARVLLKRNAALTDEVTRLGEALDNAEAAMCAARPYVPRDLDIALWERIKAARAALQPKAEGERE